MKTFAVYQYPTRDFEAVKQGFSWPAFFFGPVWMLIKKLWLRATLWLGLYVVLGLVEDVADKSEETGQQILVYLLIIAGYFALWLVPVSRETSGGKSNLRNAGSSDLGSLTPIRLTLLLLT